jgi:DNA-binding response OmpR family regulator
LDPVFTLGPAAFDRRRFTVTVDGKATPLTARELKLAEVFAAHPGEVLTRDALLNTVWGVGYFGTTRTLDQHVAQLRKKMETHDDVPGAIATVHGIGYRYDA